MWNKYSFFTRQCVWYKTDPNVPERKAYITSSIYLQDSIGNPLIELTGKEIIEHLKKENISITWGFHRCCHKNLEYYLYPSSMRIIGPTLD
ncbi:MAG: hypothetical protein CMB80_24675 [Flammeovirgaceae bacterium]|nr:hypothetical protein [Flammeovirgaceae bacterium]